MHSNEVEITIEPEIKKYEAPQIQELGRLEDITFTNSFYAETGE